MNDVIYGRTRQRHTHRWAGGTYDSERICLTCHLLFTDYEARQRRGKNNRSRGGRAELDIARTYGGEKVGPLGLPEDIRGKSWRTQVKVSQRDVPPAWLREFTKMATQRDGRTPRLILRFTKQGVKAQDFVVIRGEDWLEWFGRDE